MNKKQLTEKVNALRTKHGKNFKRLYRIKRVNTHGVKSPGYYLLDRK